MLSVSIIAEFPILVFLTRPLAGERWRYEAMLPDCLPRPLRPAAR